MSAAKILNARILLVLSNAHVLMDIRTATMVLVTISMNVQMVRINVKRVKFV